MDGPAPEIVLEKARQAALGFMETFVCQKITARYRSESHPANWQPLDVVSNLVFENGKSKGEFGAVLVDLFSPATNAQFHYRRDSRAAGSNARMYEFEVARDNSHWAIHMASQTYQPAYRGAVWIDSVTSGVLRIEMEALGFPKSFPTDHVESATDYQYVRLSDAKAYLLPVHAETLSCQRGTNNCSRNTIDFLNYRKQ